MKGDNHSDGDPGEYNVPLRNDFKIDILIHDDQQTRMNGDEKYRSELNENLCVLREVGFYEGREKVIQRQKLPNSLAAVPKDMQPPTSIRLQIPTDI